MLDDERHSQGSKLNRHVEMLEARELRCNVLQMSVGEAFNLSAIGTDGANNQRVNASLPARTMKCPPACASALK